jgi:uncharacterized protein (DUF2267 family)
MRFRRRLHESSPEMALDAETFIAVVEHDAGVPREAAERAVRATLHTLAERLSGGEAEDIAEELPPELARFMHDGNKAEPFGVDEFIRRIAEREGVLPEQAVTHARAVFAALGRTLTPDELHDMTSELPRDFGDLLAVAIEAQAKARRGVPAISAGDFYQRVADRAGLDLAAARRATDAVLEALAVRISGGQVDDLEEQLPPELRVQLERGKVESHRRAEKLSLPDFLSLIAEREGVSKEEAREHARAVFATLHEVVPEKEFRDTLAQLPDEYRPIVPRA